VDGAEPLLARATQLLVCTEDEIRRLARELRPLVLDDLGLVPALRQLAEGVTHRTGIQVKVEEGFRSRLPRAIELSLYRSAQEALSNVMRHAGARHVRLELEQAEDRIELRIRDDGCGFDTKRIGTGRRTPGLGLRGMQERAQALGGRLEVSSQPGNGSEIRMTLPVEGSHVQNGADPHPARR
jgi:signal transduction histidine kinase